MALAEYEQRKLDEIERALHSDDPGFAGSINIGAVRRHRRLVAAVVFVVGLLVLVVGAVFAQGLPLIGVAGSVLGFVVMVAGAGLFVSGQPGPGGTAGERDAHPGTTRRSRLEDRFRSRFEHPDG
jgi:predicted membrane channel-forming protein YqfA (hemolysin III family)